MDLHLKRIWLLGLALGGLAPPLWAAQLSGNITGEARHFPHEGLYPGQSQNNLSLAVQLEWVHESADRSQLFAFTPFLRIDQSDDERSHGDIRELSWLKASDDWELRLGIRKVFWGVTESQHLVDIINQTDLVESPDGEEKLGQPMINLALIRDWGTLDLFVLPYFRERTFPGEEGRLRFPVATDQALYESSNEQRHIDYALRWSHYAGDWDFGLSYFDGTGRAPRYVPQGSRFVPYYEQIQQLGLELQATKEGWLWKLEAIRRLADSGDYTATTAGFEYSFYGVWQSSSDLGLVMEHLYDSRGEGLRAPFANDLMVGLRWTMNDVQSTEALLGAIIDLESPSVAYSLEASRRLGNSWKLSLEARLYQNAPVDDPLYFFRSDDYVQIELGYYF